MHEIIEPARAKVEQGLSHNSTVGLWEGTRVHCQEERRQDTMQQFSTRPVNSTSVIHSQRA